LATGRRHALPESLAEQKISVIVSFPGFALDVSYEAIAV